MKHDGHVGKLLDKLDELSIADNTIVKYSTDNDSEVVSWPEVGSTPFRGEKDTNYEGGWRVPCAIRQKPASLGIDEALQKARESQRKLEHATASAA